MARWMAFALACLAASALPGCADAPGKGEDGSDALGEEGTVSATGAGRPSTSTRTTSATGSPGSSSATGGPQPTDGPDDPDDPDGGDDVGDGGNETKPVAWGDAGSALLRPGASLGGYCTFDWLFADDVRGVGYVGTAAHCTDALGERISLGDGTEVGAVVFDSDVSAGAPVDLDFSLVELDAAMLARSNPSMLGWDGPTGVLQPGEFAIADEVAIHGYGIVLGDNPLTRDRSGVLTDWDDCAYNADMPAVNGDSGAPLLHVESGKALGIISHYGTGAVPPSTDEGPLVACILDVLHGAGFPDVRLALAT